MNDKDFSEMEEQARQMDKLTDDYNRSKIESAIEFYKDTGDIEPLISNLENGNPYLIKHPEALSLLTGAARGELRRKAGNRVTFKRYQRDNRIRATAHALQRLGYPLKNDPELSKKQSVCRLIGDFLNLSENAIYTIVSAEDYLEPIFGHHLPLLPTETERDVLKWYLTMNEGELEGEEKNRQLRRETNPSHYIPITIRPKKTYKSKRR